MYRLGSRLLERGLLTSGQLVVHDRLDVAMALGCGIHLPEAGLPVDRVRQIVGCRHRVGVSVHSVRAAEQAAALGADYLMFGHVFSTPSKPGIPRSEERRVGQECRKGGARERTERNGEA